MRILAILLVVMTAALAVRAQDDNLQLPTLRQVPDTVVRGLQQSKDFSYANDPSFWKQKKPETQKNEGASDPLGGFLNNKVVKGFFYVILIALFLFVLYRIIAVNRLYVFRSSSRARLDDDGDEEIIQDENIDQRIRAAIDTKDYRTAVRLYYLKGLRLLSDRGLIRYHAQATNHEYINQLSQYPVASDFRFLTQVYDYVWYGEFAVNEEQFGMVQNNFQNFYRAIK